MRVLERLDLLARWVPWFGWKRLTAGFRACPSVFVIGATKSGTSSLDFCLSQHPNYLKAFTKELMFLQDLPNFVSNYESDPLVHFIWGNYTGLRSYRKFFPYKTTMSRVAKLTGHPTITGDNSPFYLYCPIAAQRISQHFPKAKIIITLRNPIDRAFSDYNMHFTRTDEETRSFEQAIEDELSGACVDFRRTFLHQSHYAECISNWLKLFPRHQLFIIRAEDFFTNPAETVKKLFTFLELPPIEIDQFPAKNKGVYRTTLKAETRARLQRYFQPHNQALTDLLGEDFLWQEGDLEPVVEKPES